MHELPSVLSGAAPSSREWPPRGMGLLNLSHGAAKREPWEVSWPPSIHSAREKYIMGGIFFESLFLNRAANSDLCNVILRRPTCFLNPLENAVYHDAQRPLQN